MIEGADALVGSVDYEFYSEPAAFTRWLFRELAHRGTPIVGRVFEPCVGSGAIPRAAALRPVEYGVSNVWVTADLDRRWPADYSWDATDEGLWRTIGVDRGPIDWTVSNPPFTSALDIITHALAYSRVGVAMHLRASIHEVLKRGVRRTWMAKHPPTGILWLPRFAYQRSKKTGDWSTDSVCACWCVWPRDSLVRPGLPGLHPHPQFICYANEQVLDELAAETPTFRARMDELMAVRGGR